MQYITSRSNPLIVETTKLKEKKYRRDTGLFAFEGLKLLEEALLNNTPLLRVFATEENKNVFETLDSKTEKILVSRSVYEKISFEKSPEGVFCVAKYLDNRHKFATIYSGTPDIKIFCLSSVRDPGNVGTIMRCAGAFENDLLIISDDCADIYSSKTIRASMGAFFRIDTMTTPDLSKTLSDLTSKGYCVYAARVSDDSVTVTDAVINDRSCFVVGNEGNGLPEEIIKSCNKSISIPMSAGCESLNVAAASGILMWERYRRIKK